MFFCLPFQDSIFVIFPSSTPFQIPCLVLFVLLYLCCPFPFIIFVSCLQSNFVTSPSHNPNCFRFWLFGSSVLHICIILFSGFLSLFFVYLYIVCCWFLFCFCYVCWFHCCFHFLCLSSLFSFCWWFCFGFCCVCCFESQIMTKENGVFPAVMVFVRGLRFVQNQVWSTCFGSFWLGTSSPPKTYQHKAS